jgi:glycosyltransferase involved in cell wall biosynthesis
MNSQRPVVLLMGDTLDVGGTEGQFVEVACRLDRRRFDVRLSCVRPEGPLRARLDAAGLSVFQAGKGSLRPARFLAALLPLVAYLRRNRVGLVHSFGFYSNLLAIPATRLARSCPVIASQRELGNLRSELHTRIHARALRYADRVLVNSPVIVERLRSRGIPESRVTVVPNGVDLSRFHPRVGNGAVVNGAVTIATLGNLRPEKGIGDFVEAAALIRSRAPSCRFVVWGDGVSRAELEKRASELGLNGSLELRGATGEPEEAMREMDIFVLPSHSEASSNSLLEAMASGLPIVATRIGGIPEMVEHGTNGYLVPARAPNELAERVLDLVRDPQARRRFGAESERIARERFSPAHMLRDIESLYDEVLGRAAPDGIAGS